jgi:predicted TIM-barrel fold metal-dependent hydrolase
MIDAHIHVVPPNLPGVGPLSPDLENDVDYVAQVVRQQMEASGTTVALAMGSWDSPPDDPLGIARTLQIARRVPGLLAIGVADPTKSDADHLKRVERQLADRRVVALKAYLGYVHHYPTAAGYIPYYELAAKYQIPFFFHTGDTYSPYAKLKYAQPIHIDEVAVDFPQVKFVMAHVGNPWTLEAAEVVYKNVNVWADLSGLLVGSEEDFQNEDDAHARLDLAERVRVAFRYSSRPNRFIYGTDWPLTPMATYRDFVREMIPGEFHDMVFEQNAKRLFGDRLG